MQRRPGKGMETPDSERTPAPRHPQWLLASASILIGIFGFLLIAELVLNLLPVASGLRSMPVDAAHPVYHFEPNRSYVFSHGWDLRNVNRGRVNNAGWVNDQDYHTEDTTPLLAVIGDSFVEAQMVPYGETMQARLAKSLAAEFRVYSFAGSGAPLSQYLIWARHAVNDYGARAVVINVVVNDFDESHAAYRFAPGFWLYVPDPNGELRLRLTPHQRGLLRTLAQRSALARYLLINLKIGPRIMATPWLSGLFVRRAQAGGPEAVSVGDARRIQDSHAVIDAFLRDLPRMVELPRNRILLTVDGFRYLESATAGAGSYFDLMRKALLAKAAAQGYEAIDLDPLFFSRRAPGRRFDYIEDLHWNGDGHAVAAEAVLSSRLMRELRQKP
jgi:hypothetical protein